MPDGLVDVQLGDDMLAALLADDAASPCSSLRAVPIGLAAVMR
jgi:hypothetical protein